MNWITETQCRKATCTRIAQRQTLQYRVLQLGTSDRSRDWKKTTIRNKTRHETQKMISITQRTN